MKKVLDIWTKTSTFSPEALKAPYARLRGEIMSSDANANRRADAGKANGTSTSQNCQYEIILAPCSLSYRRRSTRRPLFTPLHAAVVCYAISLQHHRRPHHIPAKSGSAKCDAEPLLQAELLDVGLTWSVYLAYVSAAVLWPATYACEGYGRRWQGVQCVSEAMQIVTDAVIAHMALCRATSLRSLW